MRPKWSHILSKPKFYQQTRELSNQLIYTRVYYSQQPSAEETDTPSIQQHPPTPVIGRARAAGCSLLLVLAFRIAAFTRSAIERARPVLPRPNCTRMKSHRRQGIVASAQAHRPGIFICSYGYTHTCSCTVPAQPFTFSKLSEAPSKPGSRSAQTIAAPLSLLTTFSQYHSPNERNSPFPDRHAPRIQQPQCKDPR